MTVGGPGDGPPEEPTSSPTDASANGGPGGGSDPYTVRVAYALPQHDAFHRGQPAILEGPRERWEAARSIIDLGGAMLVSATQVRPGSVRDLVLTALLRRALITAESIWRLLATGLIEAAISLHRTLLDVELNMKLVTRDSTEQMAKRLAAYHHLSYQRHGQRALADTPTREEVLSLGASGAGDTVATTRAYAAFLASPTFDEVRDAVRSSRYWHGYESQEAAFRAVGAESDYFLTYDTGSLFLHAANVEHDWSDVEDGRPALRAMVERDPERLRAPLGDMALRLRSVMRLFAEERHLPDVFRRHPDAPPEGTEVRDEEGLPVLHVDPLSGVDELILRLF